MSEPWADIAFGGHVLATVYMTGVIWFVQVVHYPLFAEADLTKFPAYAKRHQAATTRVVAPAMLVEGLTAVVICLLRPDGVPAWQPFAGMALLAVIWASTLFLQIPCHERLGRGFDAMVHRRLVSTNWIRTVAWSLRSALAIAMWASHVGKGTMR